MVKAKGFGYDEILKWGVALAKSIDVCNARIVQAKELNDKRDVK